MVATYLTFVMLAFSNQTFFFKQKTAYEIGVRLVGSEMCIRDRKRIIAGLSEHGYEEGIEYIVMKAVSYTHLTLPTKRIV